MKAATLVLLFLSVLFSLPAPAQDEPVPPIPPRRGKAVKVGAFGGYTPGLLFLDVKPLNAMLAGAGATPLNDNGVFLSGGGGAAYIMVVPNVRIGGLGMSGSLSSTALNSADIRRDAELSVGFGGVTVEYVVPIVERLDLAVGGMVGWGGIDVTLRQDAGGAKTWLGEWGNFRTGDYQNGSAQVSSVTRSLEGSFFVYVPSVSIEYALMGWLGVRLGASYVGMAAPSWELDGTHELLGVPGDITGKGFMVNAGVFLGTF